MLQNRVLNILCRRIRKWTAFDEPTQSIIIRHLDRWLMITRWKKSIIIGHLDKWLMITRWKMRRDSQWSEANHWGEPKLLWWAIIVVAIQTAWLSWTAGASQTAEPLGVNFMCELNCRCESNRKCGEELNPNLTFLHKKGLKQLKLLERYLISLLLNVREF